MIKDFKFTIVGGGTAGWLSALFLNSVFPTVSVTVVESSEIGILGAGEGTVPDFVNFLKTINISISDIIYHAQGTFKNGIKFTNWNGDGTSYFHGFGDLEYVDNRLNFQSIGNIFSAEFNLEELNTFAECKNFDNVDLSSILSYNNKVKLSHKDNKNFNGDPITHFNLEGKFALHFDARLLAMYLKKVAISRGIQLIDAKISSVVEDESHNITDIVLDDGTTLKTDFVFDCSGFHRLLIGKHYKEEWKSYTDFLPVNRALPFFIKRNETKIPSYTEAIAMKYGWVWKIPVGDRYGCGYVFDNQYITDDQAKHEIEEFVGHEITSPKTFSFNPGTFNNTWKNNVVAIGLAANFIEPLEATSIWVTTMSLYFFIRCFEGHVNNNLNLVEKYNQKVREINNKIAAFIYFHYLTNRTDTEFWENFKNKISKQHKTVCDDLINGTFIQQTFSLYNYSRVGTGLNMVGLPFTCKNPYVKQKFEYMKKIFHVSDENYNRLIDDRKYFRENLVDKCIDHSDAIQYINNYYIP